MANDISKTLGAIAAYQTGESWRNSDSWKLDSSFYADDFLKNEQSRSSDAVLQDIYSGLSEDMVSRRYLVVQSLSGDMELDGTMPVTVSLVDGKDIKNSLSLNGIDNSYAFGPSMASEIDDGYDVGTQYIMDVSSLSAKSQKSLLRSAEYALEEVQGGQDRYSGYGRDEDEDMYGGRKNAGNAEDIVKYVLTEAYDSGAKPPYASLKQSYDKAMEALEIEAQNKAVQEYAQEHEKEAFTAIKSGKVLVREAEPGEKIPVYTKNGNLKATEAGQEGKYVLTRCDDNGKPIIDKHGHVSQWQVDSDKFGSRYIIESTVDSNGKAVSLANPKAEPQKFIRVDKDITLYKPWGKDGAMVPQHIKAGGVLNVTDMNDIYGIAREEFSETYRRLFSNDKERPEEKKEEVSNVKDSPKQAERDTGKTENGVNRTGVVIAGKDWYKAVFIKPGIARTVKDANSKPCGFEIPGFKQDGVADAKVVVNLAGQDAGEKTYLSKILANSARFKNWVVVEPKKATARFEVVGTVNGKQNTHVRDIGIDELRNFVQDKNREWDRQHGQQRGKTAEKAAGNSRTIGDKQ